MLVITIVICALVGLMLAAYLSMVSSQYNFTQRSQIWNNAIPMCEAGIEEAMAHINHIDTATNFAINGWIRDGIYFRKDRNVNGGQYRMELDNGWPPIITVRGTLVEPLGNGNVTRAIQVRTKMNQRFPAAVLARGSVNLNGSGRIDSFNSTNALESGPNGQYDSSKATANALVATTLRTDPAINIGTMAVYGSAATGPGGTVRVAMSGSVGTKSWVESPAGRGKVQPGHHIDDANFYIPPANLPRDFVPTRTLPMNVPYPLVGGTNYKYGITQDGDYQYNGTVLVDSGQNMIITAQCRLLVRGSITVRNQGFILMGTNASVELYVDGPVEVGGGCCINQGGYAINFSLICLSAYPVNYGGQGKLIGTIYAPLSAVTLSGTTDAIGAVTCNSFSLVGGMGIHYDDALKGNPKIRFLASAWSEITP
jgi:hypothetical protein